MMIHDWRLPLTDERRLQRLTPGFAAAFRLGPGDDPVDETDDDDRDDDDGIPDVPGTEPPPVPVRDPLPEDSPQGPMVA